MPRNLSGYASALGLALIALATTAYAETYAVLYDFGRKNGDPESPKALVQGVDGALYGTSGTGGAHGDGTVFKMTTAGKLKVLYSFCSQSNCSDGAYPITGLLLRPDGHFLGTTGGGGTSNSGILFDISDAGALTVLYNFQVGQSPATPLILGPDGDFYGVSETYGIDECGSAFRFVVSGSDATYTLLHEFGVGQGCRPTSIVLGTDRNFYGTTYNGVSASCGTFFKMTRGGAVTPLHTFAVSEGCNPIGVTLGDDGNFYGTTYNNTIFRATSKGTLIILHELNGGTDGNLLPVGLVQATDGKFYGVANTGGTGTNEQCFGHGCGTLFDVSAAGDFNVLHDFNFTMGGLPATAPVQHTSGVIYGTANGGPYRNNCGNSYCGILYSLTDSLTPFVALTPFEGKVGTPVEILGQGFTSSTTVSFNGTPAAANVQSATSLYVTVPAGTTTGFITVTTSDGTLTSNRQFVVIP